MAENLPLCFGREELSSYHDEITKSDVADLYYLPSVLWPLYLELYGDAEEVYTMQNIILQRIFLFNNKLLAAYNEHAGIEEPNASEKNES